MMVMTNRTKGIEQSARNVPEIFEEPKHILQTSSMEAPSRTTTSGENPHNPKDFLSSSSSSSSSTFSKQPASSLLSDDALLSCKATPAIDSPQQQEVVGSNSKKRFSALLSTEQNFKAETNDFVFVGPYADIRKTLDYTYHENYTPERQHLQDKIIQDILEGPIIKDINGDVCTTPTEPFLVFTAGAMGAGKSHVMNRLVQTARFPLLAFVTVDPDDIRRHFPEYAIYVQTNAELAGEYTRKEAGLVSEILTLAALEQGKNVLVDGSLRDYEWYEQYFDQIRTKFPNIQLAIIHVTAPREAILERAAKRAQQTGRVVPQKTLLQAMEQVPKSVSILSQKVDYFAEIHNPQGDSNDIQLIQGGSNWDEFESNWHQTCKFVPKKRDFLLKSLKQANEKLAVGGRKVV